MSRCAAVRKRGSTDQCECLAMSGYSLCGLHARTRSPVLWASLHKTPQVVRIQSLIRGWLLRRRLALAGPGVVSRKVLVNDEDLFTCESKDRQHPLKYFSFEEGGKVYWFDAENLWQWMARSVAPVNPYTKTPMPNDVRKRLREWGWRNRMSCTDIDSVQETLTRRWNLIVQVFRENGFTDTHPMQFADFNRADFRTMFVFLERDLQIVLPETDLYRDKLIRICRRGQKGRGTETLHCVFLVFKMLSIPKDPYVLVFSILSAFMRC
jgi:hypothetical protein